MESTVKHAIVMGATSGIGREVAILLAHDGWKVGVAGRRSERLEELVRSEENIVAWKQVDVTTSDATLLLQELISDLGGMELYFHSSGTGWQNEMLVPEKELLTVATNGLGFTRMVTAAFRYFAERSDAIGRPAGHIACITSIAGTKGLGAAPAYSSTKRFQNHYLECLEQLSRMRHLGITLTDIRPGFVDTDLIAGSNYPLKLSAEDVAKAIVRAIRKRKRVVTIDWRYRVLVALWRLLPRWLWVRVKCGG